ncbi:MobF family relaxase [Leptolyngbya sp. GGD]|uniref:MobF family relaxase n=1 Tax=Leptolyngbya sp. GGD TaxID=2997907 RepID=UPI00227C00DF|nr:MobF family relaxase [Leptolyngbya sp. GGD]MCY6494277.1 relaxase domain-containing protein [Leptolyngbya sp. GGD]
MLTLGRVHSQNSVHYFMQDNHRPGSDAADFSRWYGQGAIALSCPEVVNEIAFSNILSGLDPTGESLPGRQIHPQHQAGIDLTFNAPKSVSLAALMGEQDVLIAAHTQAIAHTLQIVEQRYAYTRLCEQGQRQLVPTQNLVIAAFQHETSRAHDPHLHTHCVVANLTQISNGEWRTIDTMGIYRDRSLLSALYTNALADQIRQLGYEITLRPDSHFELAGYAPEQLQYFSKRRQQILDLVGEAATPAMKQWACLATRPRKILNIDAAELNEWWQAQNSALQLDIRHPASIEQSGLSRSIDAILTDAIATCTRTRSLFSQTELERRIFDRVQPFSYGDFLETLQALQQAGKLIAVGNQYWTIPDRQSFSVDVAPAIRAIAKGNTLNGFAQLLECDHVFESANPFQAAIDAYLALKPNDRAHTALIVADENSRNRLQQDLAKAQQAHESTFTLWQLQPKSLTVSQALRVQSFQINDVVIPRYHYPALGLNKGEPYTIVALHAKTFTLRDSSQAELTIAPRQFRNHLYRPQPITVSLGDRLQWAIPHQDGSHFTIAAITDTTASIQYSNGQIEQLDPHQSYFFQDARIFTTNDAPPSNLKQLLVVEPVAISLTRWIQTLPALPDNLVVYSDRIPALFDQLRNASARVHLYLNYDSTPRSTQLDRSAANSQPAANRVSEFDSKHSILAGNQSECSTTPANRPSRLEEYARNLLSSIKQYSEQQAIEFVTEPLGRAITRLTAKLDQTERTSRNQHRRTAALESAVRVVADLTSLVGQTIRTTECLAAAIIYAPRTPSINAIASYEFKSPLPKPDSSGESPSTASGQPRHNFPNEPARIVSATTSHLPLADSAIDAKPRSKRPESPNESTFTQDCTEVTSTAGKTPSGASSATSATLSTQLTRLLPQLRDWREQQAISNAAFALNPVLTHLHHQIDAALAIPVSQSQANLAQFLSQQQHFMTGVIHSVTHIQNFAVQKSENSHLSHHVRLPIQPDLTASLTDLAHHAERAARRDREFAHHFVQSTSQSQRSTHRSGKSDPSSRSDYRAASQRTDYPTQPIAHLALDLTRWHESVRDLFAQFPRRVEALHADETTEATRTELAGLADQLTLHDSSQHSGLSGTVAAITATRSHVAASITDFAAGIYRANAAVTDYIANARSHLTAVVRDAHNRIAELTRAIEQPYAIDHLTDTFDRAVAECQRIASERVIFQSLEKSSLESTPPIFQTLENSASIPVSSQSNDFSGFGWITGQGALNRVVLVETPEDATALAQLDITRLEHPGRSLYLAITDSVPKALQEWAAMPGQTAIAAGDPDFIRRVQKGIGQSQSLPVPDGFTWQKLLQMGHQNPAQLLHHYRQGLTGEPTAILLESAKRALRLGQPMELVRSMLMTAERVETMRQPQQAEQYVQAIVDRACKSVSESQHSTTQPNQRVESQRSQM